MKILIIGAGQVGFELANMLSKEEHDVCVIDNDQEHINSISEKLDAKIIMGSATNANCLEQADIQNMDLFIAVSSIDEVNIMSCLLAKEYGVERCVARALNSDYMLDGSKINGVKLGIERIVNPLNVVSQEVSKLCDYSDVSEVAKFFDDQVLHLSIPVKSGNPFIGKKLKGISLIEGKKKLVITSINRDDKIYVPSKNEIIQDGDMIFFFCLHEDLPAVRYHFGLKTHDTKKIFLIGGGMVGHKVAEILEKTNHKVKVFDKDKELCNKIATDLNVRVFCTENTDVETLENEGIAKADVVVSMMKDDYSNILTALLAKKLGAYKGIALVNDRKLSSLAYSLGVDSVISPRLATASSILKYTRRGKIVSVVEKRNSEIIEVEIPEKAAILNYTIKDLRKPKGVIFGAIKRGDELKLLSGEDKLESGDLLVSYSLSESINKLEKLFEI